MKKILITGVNGTIGTVIKNNLKDYDITPVDFPETDVKQYNNLLKIFPGHDAVIHLAWDTNTENFRSGKINTDNALMFYNIYNAALETKIPRVIMASSVHADNFYIWKEKKLLTVDKIIGPDSPYGASKVFMESLGRYYAQKGLEVVCIRFGGVNLEDKINIEEENFDKVWLSHRDCIELIKKCINAEKIPNNFQIIYAVSNNSSRIHDHSNSLGWEPKDDSKSK